MNSSEHPDIQRLRQEYASRARGVEQTDAYSLFNLAQLYTIQQRQRALLTCLRENGVYPLSDKRVLELGSGNGGVLLEWLGFGAQAGNLHGAELLFERLRSCRANLSNPLVCADGQNLPYAAASFDVALQFTVFSSVLSDEVKARLAEEMRRVVRPGGLVLWYDFWLNPTNPQTRGIRPPEIRALFPGCEIRLRRITLAPPLTRRLVGISWLMCALLEKLTIFNTHYLAAIRLPDVPGAEVR